MNDFTILAMPGAFATSVAVSIDILETAAILAPRLGCPIPRWRVVSPDPAAALGNGMRIAAQKMPKAPRGDGSVWIIPGLSLATGKAVRARMQEPDAALAAAALRSHARAGGTIAAGCSAVFLLQFADLLAARRVTTTWWLAPLLQQLEPRCVVDADRMVIADGFLITAGAAGAHTDLMLYLLRTRFSPALADAVSRALLIDGRQSQAQFIVPSMLADGDALVSKLVARFESALPDPPGVAAMAAEFGMSERTLSRHVRAATGRSTSALLQGVRLTRARALLETSKLTVDQVAERVGYVDTTALRRLMRKMMGATPRQFRPAVNR